jgi:two-component system sensor histidine kinase LytS
LFGIALFLLNLGMVFLVQNASRPQLARAQSALETATIDSTLQIAHETLPFLRRGLNEDTARQTAEIIQKISEMAAVAITDREKVLVLYRGGLR